MNHDTPTPERVRFDDGEHVTITPDDHGTITVTGRLNDEPVSMTMDHRDANYQAGLLCMYASDALWSLSWDRMERIGNALHAAAVTAGFIAGRASDGEPVDSERVALDGGHADVDTVAQHVEVTVTIGGRASIGLALSPVEADRIGQSLRAAAHRAHVARAAQIDLEGVETVTDLFNRAQETGVPASALVEVVGR